jgi:hypothetical protein
VRVVPGFNRLQTRRYNPSHQKELLGVLKNITTLTMAAIFFPKQKKESQKGNSVVFKERD